MSFAAPQVSFFCNLCTFSTREFSLHLAHRKNHRHINQGKFHCGFLECRRLFNDERILRLHILRFHKLRVSQIHKVPNSSSALNDKANFQCSVQTCMKEFDSYTLLIKHIKNHMDCALMVKCPHSGCSKSFKVVKSFSSHLSRSHRQASTIPSSHTICNDSSTDYPCHVQESHLEFETVEHESEVQSSVKDQNSLANNLAQFCMKLEYHFLMPETTIQYIMTEVSNVHIQGQALLKEDLIKLMKAENIQPDTIQHVISSAFASETFTQRFNSDLKTTYRRKEFYKKNFPFVEPEEVTFTVKKGNRRMKKTFYYIPLKETLQACFLDKSLDIKLVPPKIRDDNVLEDITDGKIFRGNAFFQENPDALQLLLYQDGFEIVNPLGAAKRKHKLVGVYLSILNLPHHIRSHISSIKLVALFKEKDFNHEEMYRRIVNDLKDLEENGILIDGLGHVKAGLVCIIGDNLGSHALGGFVENFSKARFFCRYCVLDRRVFVPADGECVLFEPRSKERYNNSVALGRRKKSGHEGVKFNSIFNELENFHVCNPGLPCCIAHDLMEGIIAYDLKLYIDYFVGAEWFTLEQLNEAIESFPYVRGDAQDKPVPIKAGADRVKGGAWQIWNFLRLFPLIILDYIDDDQDEVLKALILLTEITEVACSPRIHESHLATFQTLCTDYISLRKRLFPQILLRPKHHYIVHYAWLISMFGPLCKVWTMRFESKHTFFKRVCRMIRNYKNILFSLSMKHELLQCFLRSGGDIRCEMAISHSSDFNVKTYAKEIQDVCSNLKQTNHLQECERASVKGTVYHKGDLLVLNQKSYDCDLVFGRIALILFDCDECLHFVCEVLDTSFEANLRVHTIRQGLGYQCVTHNQLLSYHPHRAYKLKGRLYVKLKHAIVSLPEC